MADVVRHTDQQGALHGRRPMTKEQIERRTVTREEVAMWKEQSHAEKLKYLHYWETKEVIRISEIGDEHLIFAGRMDDYAAKVWKILDNSLTHNAYILRPDPEIKYDLSEKEGVLLRFQFRGPLRIYNDKRLVAVVEASEMSVFQKADDVIIRIMS